MVPGGRPGGGAEAATVASGCKPGDFLGMLGISFRDVSTFFCLASLKPSMLVEVPDGEASSAVHRSSLHGYSCL